MLRLRTPSHARNATLVGLLLAACASYPTPYSARSLARDSGEDPKGALLHYLSQSNADGRVCDANARPRARGIDGKLVRQVVSAVEKGSVARQPAAVCLGLALDQLSVAERAETISFLGERYVKALSKGGARGLHGVVMEAAKRESDAKALAGAKREVDALVAGGGLSSRARREAQEFVDMLGLLLGEWQGKVVDAAMIRGQTDPELLRMFAAKLPDPALAREAKGQLVRLEAQQSAHPEVQQDIEGVVERVLATGRNAVDPGSSPIRRATFDDRRTESFRLAMDQDPAKGQAALHLTGGGEDRLVPTFDLKKWLSFEVEGYSKPLTLCHDPSEASVDPCVEASRLRVDERIMSLDGNGLLALRDRLGIRDAIRFLSEQGGLDISIFEGEQRLAQVTLPFYFRTPAPFIRSGTQAGEAGPNLVVDVGQVGSHLVFKVSDSGQAYPVVVHRDGLSNFYIASQGAQGYTGRNGSRGSTGLSGRSGMRASCPGRSGTNGTAGGRGGNGSNGGPGGPGGDGGSVELRVHCGKACADLKRSWPNLVRSLGGAGGPGGRGGQGGPGGQGGRGGMGTTCRVTTGFGDNKRTTTKSLSGGSSGSNGMRGSDGMRGMNGAAGKDGRVRVVFE